MNTTPIGDHNKEIDESKPGCGAGKVPASTKAEGSAKGVDTPKYKVKSEELEHTVNSMTSEHMQEMFTLLKSRLKVTDQDGESDNKINEDLGDELEVKPEHKKTKQSE